MKFTFNQVAAFALAFLGLILLGLIYFFPSKGNEQVQSLISGALISVLTSAANYLIGSTSGSQAKDAAAADTTSQLIDSLASSQPVTPIAKN